MKYEKLYSAAIIFSFVSFSEINEKLNFTYLVIAFLFCMLFVKLLVSYKIGKHQLHLIAVSVVILSLQLLAIAYSENEIGVGGEYLTVFLFSVSLLVAPLSLFFLQGVELNEKWFKGIVSIFFVFFIIEVATRFIFLSTGKGGVYEFKKSFFYYDTNFLGAVLVCLYGLFLYVKDKLSLGWFGRFGTFFIILLIFLTFSRAARIGMFFLLIVNGVFRRSLKVSLLSCFIAYSIFFVMFYSYARGEDFVSIDGSFNSKFYILNLALEKLESLSNLQLTLGVGLGGGQDLLGYFSHSIVATAVIELGVISTILFLHYLFLLYLLCGKDYLVLIILPMFIMGISLFSAYMPFLFAVSSVFFYFNGNNRGDKNKFCN